MTDIRSLEQPNMSRLFLLIVSFQCVSPMSNRCQRSDLVGYGCSAIIGAGVVDIDRAEAVLSLNGTSF
jgi:hypothetical protein